MSQSPGQSAQASTSAPANRHAPTPVERQRAQLDKLLKDPSKPAYVPTPLKEKSIRPPREMMKNVQGSSAGAGSGEFHVYKASRRREYERLMLMDEESQREADTAAFEAKKRQWEEEASAKTAKNRAKRQKKKGKGKSSDKGNEGSTGRGASSTSGDAPLKKRRLINGQEIVFKRPGEEDSSDDGDEDEVGPKATINQQDPGNPGSIQQLAAPVLETKRITILEDD